MSLTKKTHWSSQACRLLNALFIFSSVALANLPSSDVQISFELIRIYIYALIIYLLLTLANYFLRFKGSCRYTSVPVKDVPFKLSQTFVMIYFND